MLKITAFDKTHQSQDKTFFKIIKKILITCNNLIYPISMWRIYKLKNPKIRFGRRRDGGYVLLDGFSYDLLLGCGISNDISFELKFLKKYNVPVYAFDGTVDKLPTQNPKIKFVKKNISRINKKNETNMHELINTHKNIFLKMDIEGGEYPWIKSLTKEQLNRFQQIVIEFHWPFKPLRWLAIKRLNKTHYLCHLHANNCLGTRLIKNVKIPLLVECTFVRKKDIEYTPSFNDEKIPSKLDRKNISHKKEIHLDGYPYVIRNRKK